MAWRRYPPFCVRIVGPEEAGGMAVVFEPSCDTNPRVRLGILDTRGVGALVGMEYRTSGSLGRGDMSLEKILCHRCDEV